MRFSSRATSSGWLSSDTRADRFASSSLIFSAYGRDSTAASCARRSLAAATIFIALVICCVLRTEAMRFLMSLREGTYLSNRWLNSCSAFSTDALTSSSI